MSAGLPPVTSESREKRRPREASRGCHRQLVTKRLGTRPTPAGSGTPYSSGTRLAAADLVEALDALLSLETWVRLRQTQGLAVARSRRVLEGAATALLEARRRA